MNPSPPTPILSRIPPGEWFTDGSTSIQCATAQDADASEEILRGQENRIAWLQHELDELAAWVEAAEAYLTQSGRIHGRLKEDRSSGMTRHPDGCNKSGDSVSYRVPPYSGLSATTLGTGRVSYRNGIDQEQSRPSSLGNGRGGRALIV